MNIFSRNNKDKRASISGLSFRRSSKSSRRSSIIGTSSSDDSTPFVLHQVKKTDDASKRMSFAYPPSMPFLPASPPLAEEQAPTWQSSNVSQQSKSQKLSDVPAARSKNRRKPPPSSPSDYNKAVFDSNDFPLVDGVTSLSRKDTIQRRASIRNADKQNKSLPMVPPRIDELNSSTNFQPGMTGYDITRSTSRSSRTSGSGPPPIPSSSPSIHDVVNTKGYAPSAYSYKSNFSSKSRTTERRSQSFAGGSNHYNAEKCYSNGALRSSSLDITAEPSFFYGSASSLSYSDAHQELSDPIAEYRKQALKQLSSGSANELVTNHQDIPKRSENRLSEIQKPNQSYSETSNPKLTDGLSVYNPNSIPPRSAGRASAYLPFIKNEHDEMEELNYANRIKNGNRVKEDVKSQSEQLSSYGVGETFRNSNASGYSKLSSDKIDELNNIYNAEPENLMAEIGVSNPFLPIQKSRIDPETTITCGSPMEKQKNETSTLNKMAGSLYSSKSLPVQHEVGSHLETSTHSSFILKDDVLNFGDDFNASEIIEGAQAIDSNKLSTDGCSSELQFKRQLTVKLQRSTTMKLQSMISEFEKHDGHRQAAIVENEIMKIESHFNKAKKARYVRRPPPSQDTEYLENEELDEELKRLAIIDEYIKNAKNQYSSLMGANYEAADAGSDISLNNQFEIIEEVNEKNDSANNTPKLDLNSPEKAESPSANQTPKLNENSEDCGLGIVPQAEQEVSDDLRVAKGVDTQLINNLSIEPSEEGNFYDNSANADVQSIIASSEKGHELYGDKKNNDNEYIQDYSSEQDLPMVKDDIPASDTRFSTESDIASPSRPEILTAITGSTSSDSFKEVSKTKKSKTVDFAVDDSNEEQVNVSPQNETEGSSSNNPPLDELQRSGTMSSSRSAILGRNFSVRTAFSNFSVMSPAETVIGSVEEDYDEEQANNTDNTIDILNFSSTSLKPFHFKSCKEVWSLSGIYNWIIKFDKWFPGQVVRKKEWVKSLELLMKYYYPKLNSDLSVELISIVLTELTDNFNCLMETADEVNFDGFATEIEDYCIVTVKLKDEIQYEPTGVLTALLGCYSTNYSTHLQDTISSCYSIHCPHENKKLVIIPAPEVEDPNKLKSNWMLQWGVEQGEINTIDKQEFEMQNRIYDLIRKQYDFLNEAEYLVDRIGKSFLANPDAVVYAYPDSKEHIHYQIFATVQPLIDAHRKYLFEPMKKVLFEQGKYIRSGIFELYKDWTRGCFGSYVEYIDNLAETLLFMDFEKDFKKSSEFLEWLDTFPAEPISPKKFLSNYFFYNLVLYKNSLIDIKKKRSKADPEYHHLTEAIAITTIFCDKINKRLGASEVHTLFKHFNWKIGPNNFNIEFSPNNMTIVAKEKVLKKSSTYVGRWPSTQYYLILFNNCLFLSEIDVEMRKFKIVEKPMPIALIHCEIPNSSEMEEETTLSASMDPNSKNAQDLLKFMHMGQKTSWTVKFLKINALTLWLNYIKTTKAAHAKEVADTFQFNVVVSDITGGFSNQSNEPMSPTLGHSNSLKRDLTSQPAALPIIKAGNNQVKYAIAPASFKKAQCALIFTSQSVKYYLVGTSNGLFLRTDFDSWVKISKLANIQQLEYIESAKIFLVLADKKFMKVNEEDLLDAFRNTTASLGTVKLSNQSVEFFGSGYIKGSYMVFYMKVKVTTSVTPYRSFKVLSLDKKRRGFKPNSMFDKFFSAVDCYDCSTFQNSVVLKTEKGFQMLDKELSPVVIPRSLSMNLPSNFQSKEAEFFKMMEHRVSVEKPIASFEIRNGKEILLVFSTFAVFCNERGFLSKIKLLEFNVKCSGASLINDETLFLVSKNAIEVFDLKDSDSIMYPRGFITGNNFEVLNHESVNNGSFLVMASKESDNTKMLLELTKC
ncbi:hypothetical protein DASC09_039770 [Saccharomycopsis crataegensis]|uniref:Uncharacterized protein n=1 Tax=Saccharomycopsis crataegensis TaxID=43959 RepID=A0AAV5QQ75_9ASCO|nr:hypothetical protein DASC09_039770 [Saccharomycopsis crataegensis]